MDLKLAQFHETFFEESFEALDNMEAALLRLDVRGPDPERVNTIFRVAHSIKGGAAMFGFKEVASFTHTLETLLHELRSGRMQVAAHISDKLLQSVDVLRAILAAVQRKDSIDMQKVADLQFDLEAIVAGKGGSAPVSVRAGAAGGVPIVDGQSVSVGTETYIVPLTSIVESLRLQPQAVNRLSGRAESYSFRGEYLPIVRLHNLFGVTPQARALQDGLIVVAEGDGRRIGPDSSARP